MSWLSHLDGLPPAVALVVVGPLILWLGWRKPTWVFLIALAALAIRPQLLWDGPRVGYEWGWNQTLLVFAMAVNALHYGVRRGINWPIVALIAVLILNLTFGTLHPKLTLPFMLVSLATLALPFAFTQVVLAPGSRRLYPLVIILTPLLSVALGGVLQLLEIREVFSYDRWLGNSYRLAGATGDAAVFAALAFAGFAIAVHEATRPGRPYALPLATVNLILVILSGTRMAMLASALFLVVYTIRSGVLRDLLRDHRGKVLIALALVAATFILYWPTLQAHMWGRDEAQGLSWSGRENLWPLYYDEFLRSPVFGRGIGSGFVAGSDWFDSSRFAVPHNEYLHLLVIGGVLGFVLVALGVGAWYRELLHIASPDDGDFLLALAAALAAYAVTDNVLFYATLLGLYAYLGVLLARPLLSIMPASAEPTPEAAEPPVWVAHASER